ncbi:unnamed protein product [Soboliphyme baturini]|uniref:DUF676 domain-containing protein n=1 Tax=Soboliphyme baturini TaxID=241478 RepID=A0A183IR64_9BILA|nr:unnamed protein product [Soboliphyme baturini]
MELEVVFFEHGGKRIGWSIMETRSMSLRHIAGLGNMIVSRSKELIRKLKRAGVGSRPVIWVTHSMGGILVKEMLHLMDVDLASAALAPDMLDSTIGCVFYSTPHLGVPFISNLLERSYRFFLLPSVEIKYLCEDSPQLNSLNASFIDLLKRKEIPCLSFIETVPTKLPWTNYRTVLVPEKSANVIPGYCYRLNERHLNTCKPETRDSINYRALYQFIVQLLQD